MQEGDSYDMRKKLPFCVGLLLRLLRKNLRVFVTCTSGFDRSPACVIAYLHWMTDVSLHAAYTWGEDDANVVKVIERPLNEKERFMLAKAARCIAFSISPITLAPK
ncbi:hypothetical protein V8G54_018790 [Vigna mungo]|uniref:Tyrosine specific protein phosphatases domain-containing protein n=1 Tax=Vigna mungo TaxID=3915 RepID=A0AAQ3N8Y6_VIGMU